MVPYRSITLAIALILASQLVLPSQAGAKWQPPKFEIGGFGGIVYYDTNRSLEGWNAGARFAYFPSTVLGLEGQFTYSPAEAPNQNAVDETFMWQQADLVFQIPMGRFVPFGKIGVGNTSMKRDNADRVNKFTVDTAAGAKLWLSDRIGIRTDVAWYFLKNHGYVPRAGDRLTDYMLQIGLQIGFGAGQTDADGDGVPDEIDVCPATPMGVVVDARGCPVDTDGDGIPDYQDDCDDTPSGARVDGRGCPMDSDGDGVYDGLDQCAATPAGATVDATGCPVDSDDDGVFDGIDQCPDTPSDVQVDVRGCPIATKIEAPLVLHSLNFASGSGELLPESYPALAEVVASLKAHPEVRIEIRGYADSSGPEELNQRLTQERADSVKTFLVKAGIESSRLVAKGYGEANPIADNSTKEGRAQNRRVELHPIN
jgi:OOP family OmpA-OmpF porin